MSYQGRRCTIRYIEYFVAIAGGILAIAIFLFGISSNAIMLTPEKPHYDIVITGLNGTYTVNQTIHFAAIVEGYGYACGDGEEYVTYENGTKTNTQGSVFEPSCMSDAPLSHFRYQLPFVSHFQIRHAGDYTLVVTFAGIKAKQDFQVLSPIRAS